MANKNHILVVGAAAAAVLGGYLLKEAFKADKVKEYQKGDDYQVKTQRWRQMITQRVQRREEGYLESLI